MEAKNTVVRISPTGNPEVYYEDEVPTGYLTQEEWDKLHNNSPLIEVSPITSGTTIKS